MDKIKSFNEDAFTKLQGEYFERNLEAYFADSSATGNKQEAVKRIREAFHSKHVHLILNNLDLNKLPIAVGQLTQLQHLDLSENKLIKLPNTLRQLTQLEYLNLRNNQLIELPAVLGQLARLHILDLSKNQLTELPDELGLLTQLQNLNLSENKLIKLPDALRLLIQLHTLDLSETKLREWPDVLGQLMRLQHLNLSRNALTELPDALGQLVRLQALYLSENQLTELPDALGQLVWLHVLYLRGNQLKELPDALGLLTQLQNLDLSENQLIKLPDVLGQLTQLRRCYLAANKLTELPSALRQLTQLAYLFLEKNPNLRELPLTFGSLPELMYIGIGGTALDSHVVQAVLQQCEAVRRAQEQLVLPMRLQTWKIAGNSQVDLSDIERFTDDDKGTLNEWLIRLEKTTDFLGKQQLLAEAVCEMFRSMTQNEALKMLFLAHMAVNIRCCEDRAAQSFNELYISWKVQECSKDVPLQERLSIMVRGAKTLALRNAIAARIKSWEQANKRDEKEAVEIYLFYEIALKEPLDLLSIIQTMRFADIGRRDWINKNALIATVQSSYVDHLIDIPTFAQVLAEDKKFMEMWDPQAAAFATAADVLSNSPQANHPEFSEQGILYQSEMNAVMQARKRAYQGTVVKWLASFCI